MSYHLFCLMVGWFSLSSLLYICQVDSAVFALSVSLSSTFLPLLASSALLSGAFALLSPVFALLELFFALPSSVLLASFFLLSLQEV